LNNAHVLPNASAMTPQAIADAARAADVPLGSLPNGSGLRFGTGPENERATSVIWEWVKPRTRAVVWPRTYATSPIITLPLS
jgi:branched-chain amino acid transport system substrate-binding protein